MLKDLFKGSTIYGIAPFVPRIVSIFLLPVLTRYLTSTDYGIIGTITSITFVVQALQDLGLRVIMTNYFYKSRTQYKIIWREIYGFLSLWMILYAVILSTLLFFFIPDEAANNRWLIIMLTNFTTVCFGPTAIVGQSYYQLNLQPFPVAWRLVLSGVISLLTNFVCVVLFRWGYLGAYVGTFAGTFITNITYWPVVNRKLGLSPIYNFKRKTILRSLKVTLPTIPHYYSGFMMNSSNVVAMNYYGKPQSQIGYLTMAQSFSNMFEAVLNAINQVWSPMSYQFIRDNNQAEMKRILYTFILMAYGLTFFYSLWSREIYDILISNDEIAAKYKYSIILVMALNYRPMYVYCINYFFYHEHTVQMLGITFMAGIVSCSFYFLMIPYLGVYAALIGFYLGCLYLGYSGFSFRFYYEKTIYNVRWYLIFVLQILLTIVVYYCVELSILSKIIISLIYISILGLIFITKVKNDFVKALQSI